MDNRPKVKVVRQYNMSMVYITGDLIMDMPNVWKKDVMDELMDVDIYGGIAIDLASIGRLSHWGEIRIKNLVRRAVTEKERVLIVIDKKRVAMYEGLKIELLSLPMERYITYFEAIV
jgi:hypothetical protein